MGCFAYQEKVSEYIDDLLPPAERRQLEEHMATCPVCSTLCQDLKLICEASRNLPQYEPSPVVWERIRAELSPGGVRMWTSTGSGWMARWFPFRADRFNAWSWQPTLAAVFTLVFFLSLAAIIYYRSSTPPSEPPVATRSPSLKARGASSVTVQPVNQITINKSLINKSLIEVELVQQRIEELQKRLEVAKAGWSPEVRALYRRQLQLVDQCISRCQEKFAVSDDHPAVRAVYEAALRAKLEMLKQFSDL